MKVSALAFRAVGFLCLALLAPGVDAQTPAPAAAAKPAARPVATTFEAVHDGKHGAGKLVDFPVVLLPETAIQNKSGAGKITYYVLAVPKEGAYMKAAAAAQADLLGRGAEILRDLPAALDDDKRYRELTDGLDGLLKRAFDPALPVEETIAVEVPGLAAVASAYDWETVADPNKRPFQLEPFKSVRPDYAFSIDAVAVRRDLVNLGLARPPKMDQALPQMSLSPLFKFANQAELDNFNAAVDLYNAERLRRRAYLVERSQADHQLALDRLDSRLALGEEKLSATVIAPPTLAKETFSRIHKGVTPASFVRERGKAEASLVRRALATTTVQVCSYPSGAKVLLDGKEIGATPVLARSLPSGAKLTVAVGKPEGGSHEVSETVPMRASGTKRFEYDLVAAKPRLLADDEAKRLFDPTFKPGRPFTLAISSPPTVALPKPKKETKEQKKEREGKNFTLGNLGKYVDTMRKAVSEPEGSWSPWYRMAPGTDAEVVVDIVEIQPSDRRSKTDSTSTYRVRARLAGDPADQGFVEDINPYIAKPLAPLEALAVRLKNERWPRLLGIE